ncbi:MAG: TetR family transcriptional regulator [Acidobacteria bacterium]|nr:TetR family transcriptional regulator [Acidobacteriota bacterium]
MTKTVTTRDRICSEAASLFSQQGFNGTSMAELSIAVGITKSSLYHHFASKQALLSEIIERTVSRVTPLVQKVADMDIPVTERLARAVVLHTIEAIRDRDAIACFIEEGRYLSPDFLALHITNRDRYEQIFRRIFTAGIESGEFADQDAGIAVKAILGMCNSVVRWYRPDGHESPQQIASQFAHLAVHGATSSRDVAASTRGYVR